MTPGYHYKVPSDCADIHFIGPSISYRKVLSVYEIV